MPDLPQRKVGIVACSGEELPDGTVTRLAALKVLEELRLADTVTICLPLLGASPVAAAAQPAPAPAAEAATCACGSGIPVQAVEIAGEQVTLVALPLIFAQQYTDGKRPQDLEPGALLELVKIYNPLPAEAEAAYRQSIAAAYAAYCASQEAVV